MSGGGYLNLTPETQKALLGFSQGFAGAPPGGNLGQMLAAGFSGYAGERDRQGKEAKRKEAIKQLGLDPSAASLLSPADLSGLVLEQQQEEVDRADNLTRFAKARGMLEQGVASGAVNPTAADVIGLLPIEDQASAISALIAPLTPADQAELDKTAAQTELAKAQAVKASRAPVVENFDQKKGSDLGLTGQDADKLFNVSRKTGKITSAGGGTTINLGNKVEQERAIQGVRRSEDRQDELIGAMDAGSSLLNSLDRMAAIEGDATSGTVGSAILPVTKVIEEVTGLDLPQDVAASEEFKSLASNLQILSTGPLKGAVSDFEQRLVAETQAGLGDSREGRGRKLQTLKAITETAVQRANLQSELISQGTDRVAARKQAFEQIPTPAALTEGGSSPKGDSDKKRLKFNPATGGFE